MLYFSKQIHKKLWYHIALSLGSALVTVALFDTLCSLSWLCKDYEVVSHYTGEEDSTTPINLMDIVYWIFVSYRMILSVVICVGGIFMGRRIIVIAWLMVSLCIDLIHLSETTYILSRPNLARTWPVVVAITSCIWQELKIVRIKYRIIRRSLLVDTNNNPDKEYEPDSFHKEMNRHRDTKGKLHFKLMNNTTDSSDASNVGSLSLICLPFGTIYDHASVEETRNNNTTKNNESEENSGSDQISSYIANNAIHFIKLLRNLYNLLTWHFTGYLFGGDYQHLISSNNRAALLEQSFVRHARVFLDVLTVIYIVQEKKLLLTPWIMAYLMVVSACIAIFLFTLLYLNLLTTLFASIYYAVFSIDLFFRCSFLLFCIRYVLRTKKII